MNILLRIFIALFCVGCFFSTAVCNIGFLGATGLLVLELFFDGSFRQCFIKFHRTHKIWLPVIFILFLDLLEIRWNASDFAIRLGVACKYLRFGTVLVFVPGFLYHRRSLDFLFHTFSLAAFVWCLFHVFYGNGVEFFICAIHVSFFVAYLCIYYTANILRQKNVFFNSIRLMYFTLYLLCVNTEKTGVVVTGFVVFLLLLIAVLRINKRNMKTILLLCMEVVILFSSAWGFCFYINAPIAQRTKNVIKSGSVCWRIKMIKESQKIIKDNKKIGVGTGGYRQVLIDRNWDYLGFKNRDIPNKPHPHNEWLLWVIQWGVFGLLGLVLWFGYNFVYFLKSFRLKLYRKTEMFYRLLGVLLNVGGIIAGGCEAIFFRTSPFTFYLMVICGCIARVYTLHKPEIR